MGSSSMSRTPMVASSRLTCLRVVQTTSAQLSSSHGGCDRILVRQVAGAIARRIVTYPEVGQRVDINQNLGFIKFGSRVDLYLPLGTKVHVKVGQKVQGNITDIATLPR